MIKKIRGIINNCPEWLANGLLHAVVTTPFVVGVCIVLAHFFMFLWNYLLVWLLPFIPVIDAYRAFVFCALIFFIIWLRREYY